MKIVLCQMVLFFWGMSCVFGQDVQGVIQDTEKKVPVPGATISILNTSVGTFSAPDGSFLLKNTPDAPFTVLIRHLGYASKTIHINPNTLSEPLTISLEPSVIRLNQEIVITSKRYATTSFESPEAISTLNRQELEQLSPRTTPEALMGLTGVWIQKTNHGGGTPFLRGLTGNQTLIMLDGIRLNNSTFRFGPNQYLNTIDPNTIHQIEALRGAGAVQYGSDALGGTLHILTRDPEFSESGLDVSGQGDAKFMSAGMENTLRGELGLSSGNVALLGGVTYNDFGDIKGGGDVGKQRPSGYQQLSADLKTKFKINDRHAITFAYQYLNQQDVPLFHKVELEDFALNQFDPQRRQLTYARWTSFYKSKWFKKVTVTGFYTQSDEGRQSRKNTSAVTTDEEDVVKTTGGILEVLSTPSKRWSFNSGVEYYDDRVSSSKLRFDLTTGFSESLRGLYPDGATYANLALFTLHHLDFGAFSLHGGLRYNTFSINIPDETIGESTLTPSAFVGSIALQYALHPNHRLIASFNNTFRAPNINDLGTLGIVDFRYEVPSNDLSPEQSLNMDLTYKVRGKNFAANFSVYRNELRDLITRVRGTFNGQDSISGYAVFQKKNVREAFIQGVEMDLAYQFNSHWGTTASLIFTYGEDRPAGKPLRRIPPLHGRLGLKYTHDIGFFANLELLYAAKQTRLSGGDRDDNRIPEGGTPGFQVLNFYAGYQYKWIQVNAGLQNIFNEVYRTHGSGIDGYGRSVWVSTRLMF